MSGAAPSAKGLYRATGNRRRERAVGLVLGAEPAVITDAGERAREAHDFYPTPPEPTWALGAAEAVHLRRYPLIWESAVGDGAMARELVAMGHQVIGSDLIDRGCGATIVDYLTLKAPLAPAAVTNPPFALASSRANYQWITHGWQTLRLDYMALLLPWQWAGAEALETIWARMPPSRLYLMRWKIDFTGEKSPPSYFCWAVWDRSAWNPYGHVPLYCLTRPKAPPAQGTLFGGGHE